MTLSANSSFKSTLSLAAASASLASNGTIWLCGIRRRSLTSGILVALLEHALEHFKHRQQQHHQVAHVFDGPGKEACIRTVGEILQQPEESTMFTTGCPHAARTCPIHASSSSFDME